jgi:hypothetical protein
LPGLPRAESQVAVPAVVLGQVVGVLVVESPKRVAFTDEDEAVCTVIAGLVASAIEIDAMVCADEEPVTIAPPAAPLPIAPTVATAPTAVDADTTTRVRFFGVDGSTFLDGDYLIKGVAGRILWSLLGHYSREGRRDFTNKEVRLDPSLELPEFRDNLESRLILLKRRLDEREAPIRIEKTGRGRFRLLVQTQLALDPA